MTTRFLLTLLFIYSSVNSLLAQTPDLPPIQIDRSNNTFTPFLTEKGFLQVESGLLGESNNGTLYFTTPSLLLKYGVTKKVELRLSTSLLWMEGPVSNFGMSPLNVGLKSSLIDQKGVIPQVALIAELGIDEAATGSYKAKYLAPRFRLLFQHNLSKKFSLGYNLGMEWNGFTPYAISKYTICGNYNLTDKFCLFAEVFGSKAQNGFASHYADAGVMVLLNNHSMIDLSGGLNIAGKMYPNLANYYYAALGYSFRINTIKKVETIFVR